MAGKPVRRSRRALVAHVGRSTCDRLPFGVDATESIVLALVAVPRLAFSWFRLEPARLRQPPIRRFPS